MATTHWSRAHVAGIADKALPTAPVLQRNDLSALIPGVDLWDLWPVQDREGRVVEIAGGALFMVLSAPAQADPGDRHAIARIRLLHRVADVWHDLGPIFPDGFTPGSREWAGSAVLDPDRRTVTLYFTAAGRRGESGLGFEQRLFETRAQLVEQARPRLEGWSHPVECVAPDGVHYMRELSGGGGIGTIKAFRDPAYFRDPASGREYLLFTASLARSASDWNGAIGVACRIGGKWTLGPPLIAADGLNNELERPHIVVDAGRYHLFWSTQRKVFAADGPAGPNGLYGMVADRFDGPWRPLNDTGLVLANPAAAPYQAYSWLVLADLSVLSFADMVGIDHAPANAPEARAHFGGVPAPTVQLIIDGDSAWPA